MILDESLFENISVEKQLPQYLYHATYPHRWKKIQQTGGLKTTLPRQARNWSDSRNVICLSEDPDVAESYAETALVELNRDQDIVILKINTKYLDKNYLSYDANILYDEEDAEEGFEQIEYEYSKDIPLEAISLYKKLEESIDQEKSEIYYRFEVFDHNNRKISGGLFRGLNKFLEKLYREDDPAYEDLNYWVAHLEYVTPFPENFNNNKAKFAYKKSFVNKYKDYFDNISELLDDLDWELLDTRVQVKNSDIVYEDDVQIAYTTGVSLEEDVSLDAKWGYNKHKIMEKNGIMKIKSVLIEDSNLKCEYCGTFLSPQDQKCPSCGASRQETLDHYKELKAKAAKQKEDSKKKWVAYIIDWHDSKDIKIIASNRFFNLSEVLNWLRSYKSYSDIKSGAILIEMGNEYKQKEIPINDGKVTIPNEAELVKSNKYNVQTLNESKKRKKKISQINPGEAIFKSVKDMQKWVKKRQKGLSPFCYLNPDAGNVEYNNMMFNKIHGMADASSNATIDGGASDAAPSGGDVGGSMGMGESLEMDKDNIKLSSKLVAFMKEHKDLINEEDWDTLFLDYAEDELSEKDQSQLVQVLISIGCDIEVMD